MCNFKSRIQNLLEGKISEENYKAVTSVTASIETKTKTVEALAESAKSPRIAAFLKNLPIHSDDTDSKAKEMMAYRTAKKPETCNEDIFILLAGVALFYEKIQFTTSLEGIITKLE